MVVELGLSDAEVLNKVWDDLSEETVNGYSTEFIDQFHEVLGKVSTVPPELPTGSVVWTSGHSYERYQNGWYCAIIPNEMKSWNSLVIMKDFKVLYVPPKGEE